ncbi:MAG: hypothetical protein K6F76_01460 [Clostridiales bacterium]|nr:hypothetical protein [Clostridiales bacterium]
MSIIKKTVSVLAAAAIIVCMLPFAGSTKATARSADIKSYGRNYVDTGFLRTSDKIISEASDDIPASYDSRTTGCITPVKFQGDYGSCWAHASLSACESSLIKNNGYDKSINLSEAHLCYSAYGEAYDALGLTAGDSTIIVPEYREYGAIDFGGDIYSSTLTLARWEGVVDEIKNPEFAYSNASVNYSFASQPEKAYSLNCAVLTNAYWVRTEDANAVKRMIMKYGSGDFGYYHDDYDYYYNEDTAAYCLIQNCDSSSAEFLTGNHEVSVVGWDDNYPKTNFKRVSRPQSNGAWLCKNSWDTDWGDDGYFWISYEDSVIKEEYVGFYSLSDISLYDNNYQYDGTLNVTSEYETNGSTGTMANIFTCNDNEILKAVSFYSYNESVDYSVDVYKGVSPSNPIGGQKITATPVKGHLDYCGYYTIALPNEVQLKQGERFSVVVTMKCDSSEDIVLPCDKTLFEEGYATHTNAAHEGESFYSENGSSWEDVSKKDKINFRIKAFTKNNNGFTDTESDPDSNNEQSDEDYFIKESLMDEDTFRIDDAEYFFCDEDQLVKIIGQITYIYDDYKDSAQKRVIIQDINRGTYLGITLCLSEKDVSELSVGQIIMAEGIIERCESALMMTLVNSVEKTDTDVPLMPYETVTLEELTSDIDSYFSKAIRIENVKPQMYEDTHIIVDENGCSRIVVGSVKIPQGITDSDKISVVCTPYNYDGKDVLLVGLPDYYEIYRKDSDTDTGTDSDDSLTGDVNCDGDINMLDITTLQKIIAQLVKHEDFGELSHKNSDCDFDGEIKMTDVTLIQKYIAKLIEKF